MRNKRKNRHENPLEVDILVQKLDEEIKKNKALQAEVNELKLSNSNDRFILNIVTKERDKMALAARYLTHIFLLMDCLDKILQNDYTLGCIVKDAMIDFKAKLNEGMLDIKYNGKDLWFGGDIDDNDLFEDEDE